MNTNGANISSSGTPAPAPLRPGSVLRATVSEDLGENRYRLNIGTQRVQVESPVRLAAGQKLNVQVIRQENGNLGLQLMPEKSAPPQTGTPAGTTGKSAATANAAATAEVSRQLRVSVDADALRTLLPDSAASKDRVSSGLTGATENTAASTEGVQDTANPARAGQDSTSPNAKEPVILQLVRAPGGGVSLYGAGGSAEGYMQQAGSGAASGSVEIASSAGSASAFRLQSANLILELQLPDGSAAHMRLPVDSTLLQSLPAKLAGSALLLQTATASAATAPGIFLLSSQGVTLPSTLPLELPEALSQALQQLPAGTRLTATISELAELQGQLRTQLTANIDDSASPAAHLQAAGLTPGKATLESAQALLEQGVPVSRGNVQTLLALAAGCEGEARVALVQAGARLLALDAPVALPLAAGMTNLLAEDLSLSGRAAGIESALNAAADLLPEEMSAGVREQARLVGALPVLVGDPQTPQALSNFVSSLGRELLGSAQQAIENAAGQLVAASPTLQRLDAALEAVLARLTTLPVTDSPAVTSGTATGLPAAAPHETPLAPPLPGTLPTPMPNAAGELPDATLQTPLPLPPESAPLSGSTTSPGNFTTAVPLGAATGALPPALPSPPDAPTPTGAMTTATATAAGGANAVAADALEQALRSGMADRLKLAVSLFGIQSAEAALFASAAAHPGVQELPDYARPLVSDAPGDSLQQAVRNILHAQTPDEAALAARTAMRALDTPAVRELAAALQQVEREELSGLPGMQHLREASNELRELGRTFLAQKAENLAGQEQNPAVWSGQIPLRFGDSNEDGSLQMFYRRGKKEQKEWTQRVVLDLIMSGLGGVVGDLQFFQGQLGVALLSPDQDTVRWLESGADELSAGLEEAGFPCAPGFRVLQKQQAKPAEEAPRTRPGRLDIRA